MNKEGGENANLGSPADPHNPDRSQGRNGEMGRVEVPRPHNNHSLSEEQGVLAADSEVMPSEFNPIQ